MSVPEATAPAAVRHPAGLARFCMRFVSWCYSFAGRLPFSAEMQLTILRHAQAEPKITATDHPTPDPAIEIKGYGHLRGKARLVLNRTSASE